MTPLEIEDEQLSLVEETSGRAPHLRKRNNAAFSQKQQGELSDNITGFRGLLRSKTAYVIRNVSLLGILAWMAYIMMTSMENAIEDLDLQDSSHPLHQSSFGHGVNPGSMAFSYGMPDWKNLVDNIGQEVISVSDVNAFNFVGRYWHDPYKSMYASDFYEEPMPDAQTKFEAQMNETLEQYGGWNFIDLETSRQSVDFRSCGDLFDCPSSKFPASAWQADEQYVGDFIREAKLLITRVKEGIYEEYGHSSFNDDGVTRKSEEEMEERSDMFKVAIVPDGTFETAEKGVAILSESAWNGLIRKLLHSIITSDYFFVTVVGDDIAAGHGNNFFQSAIMQFQYLMEPVFDLLNVHLLSRNMASSDPSSRLLGALAGGDLYGEMDILWYDVEDEVESQGVKDLLFKQSILSGDRVPLILTEDPVEIWRDSNNTAWMGSLNFDEQSICGKNSKQQVCNFHDYNTVCWIPRNDDIFPGVDQDDHIKNPGLKYPGRYVHQLKARKLSMLLLHALDAALDVWVDGIETNGFPLEDSYWHVGNVYTNIRESVRKNPHSSACSALMGPDFEALCHVELHGRSEWAPRITPALTGLKSVLSGSLAASEEHEENIYNVIDLWPKQWEIPQGQIDPHLLAIATYIPNVQDDFDQWEYDDDAYDWSTTDDDVVLQDIFSPQDPTITNTTTGTNYTSDGGSLRRLTLGEDNMNDSIGDHDDVLNDSNWSLYNIAGGFCDGSSRSMCHRTTDNTCLMAGHVDYPRGGIKSTAFDSGWLKFLLTNVNENIILLRLEWDNEDPGRSLKQQTKYEGFWLDYMINDNEENMVTLDHQQFLQRVITLDQVTVLPILWKSSEVQDKKDGVTLSLRARGGSKMVTHLYYA